MDSQLATTLIEQSPDAVIFAGTDGVIGAWNAEAERVFGHSASEALGQTLDLIIPEQFRDAHWTGYDRALGDKVTKYKGQALTTRATRKGGETIYVDLGFAIVLNDAGEAIGALATARDVTERFNRDREMRRELRELKAAAKP
ncbi:MAG: PAS domain-containing protein [Dehalococcoidia bacterium]